MKKTSIALAALFAVGITAPTFAAEIDVEPAAPTCKEKVQADYDAAPHLLGLPIAIVGHILCVLHHEE